MSKSGPISLPRGGGAIQGLGETFAPDQFTGTGNITLPLTIPAGRNGLQPSLKFAYSSGNGNGLYGLGWSVPLPSIGRKTSAGIPVYDDERDTFVYGGAEDLVPAGGNAARRRYRPRSESLFARIDHVRTATTDHWEVRTKDGILSVYGTPETAGADPAVIANPLNRRRVLTWALTRTEDTFGNRVEYEYERDAVTLDGPHNWDQLYPSRIRYADHGDPGSPSFLISVLFFYGTRPDPFSHYRGGFEVRTVRRCRRIELHTHPGPDLHVGSFHLRYVDELSPSAAPANGVSLLAEFQTEGLDGAATEMMPPMAFGYSALDVDRRRLLPVTGPDLPPLSLAQANFELVDLFGAGLPDLLWLAADGVRYWRNLGEARFDWSLPMQDAPAGLSLADPGVQLVDATGDGRQDLLVTTSEAAGFFPMTFSAGWARSSFRPYATAPSFNLEDPDVKLVDLDGDGVVDAIRSSARFECFFNDADEGWRGVRTVERRTLDDFPDVTFSDPRVRWADMTGDGMQDIVTIHDRCVEYWPNLGYGDWAPRITMRQSPELPFDYDPRRLLLGDIDGDGAADLIYVDDRQVTLWLNQSGNGWGEPIVITGTPPMTNVDGVRLVDLLGSGVSGVLWSGLYDDLARTAMFFLDLTGRAKPYLMTRIDNRLGAVNTVEYATSTSFRLKHQQNRKTQWKTPLPFPVQVVARVESNDLVSGNTITSTFDYHHGYWDGVDREFRGFGRVDRCDAESGASSPPLETRRWFHIGPVADTVDDWREADFTPEYWPGDASLLERPAAMAAFLGTLPRSERREALRALRGQTLRIEIYARDGSTRESRPYTVTESLCGVREEPSDTNSFFAFKLAERTTQWERGEEPMSRFAFIAEPDAHGQQQVHLDVAVPRGRDPTVAAAAGAPYLATVARMDWAARDDASHYLLDRLTRSRSYEVENDGSATVYALREAVMGGSATLRLLNQVVNFYDGPAFQGLGFGQIGDHGAVSRTEELVLTPAVLAEAWPTTPPYLKPGAPAWTTEYPAAFRTALPPMAGYVFHAADAVHAEGWYAMTARRRYDFQAGPGGRGVVLTERSALGADTTIGYDAFGLYPVTVTGPNGLVTTARYSYRVMQVEESVDLNGNRTFYRFSPLGRLAAQIVMGKTGETVGDTIAKPTMRWLYDDHAFMTTGKPNSARAIQRVHHVHDDDVPTGERDRTIETVSYSDGFGRIVQTRAWGEDRLFGDPVRGDAGLSTDQSAPAQPAVGVAGDWVLVSEWKRYDNKGRVIESFEPFFDKGWAYAEATAAQRGVATKTFYDPRGQAIRSVRGDGAETRVLYGIPVLLTNPDDVTPTPWEAYHYDVNDNAGRTHPAESIGYKHHWNTPRSQTIDALARVVEVVQRPSASPADWIMSRSNFDAQGRLVTVTDQLGRVATRQAWDHNGRLLRSDHIDAGVRRTMHDAGGGVVEHRDGKGALVLYTYDVMHRKTGLWARDRTGGKVTRRERLLYGESTGSGLSPAAAAAANLLGVLVSQYDESGLSTMLKCDFKGNQLEKERQVLGDQAFLRAFSGAGGWQIPAFSVDWDDAGAESQLESVAYRTSTTYDGLNRVKRGLYPADGSGTRHEILPQYHRGGGLRSLSVDGNALLRWASHNAWGRRIVTVYANGLLTRQAHEPLTRGLRRVRSERYTETSPGTYAPSGSPLQDIGYEKDLAGNILVQRMREPGAGVPGTVLGDDALDRTFEYDAIYRLISATGRESAAPGANQYWDPAPRPSDPTATREYLETYRYDAAGNLSELKHQAGALVTKRDLHLAAGTNRLASVTQGAASFVYEHDAVGNITAETTSRHFEWDHADRLASFRVQTAGAEPSLYTWYVYDASGARVKKLTRKQGGAVESTVYIGGVFEIRRWGASSGQRHHRLNVNEAGARLATLRFGPAEPGDPSPAQVYQLADTLGSASLTVDGAGTWISREEFTPFGQTSFGGFSKKRYRFGGKERDEESGLDYVGMRYYAPWLGRWTSTDPAGMASGFNLYTYVHNNPVNHTDPLGLQEVSPEEQQAREEGGVPVSDPEKEREADAGAGPPPADMGSGVHYENEESAKETQATQIPGGAAPPAEAQRGQKAMETNKHQNEWAQKQSVKGMKQGAKEFGIDMAKAALLPAYLIRPKKTDEMMDWLESMRGSDCDTELCNNVSSGTYWSMQVLTMGVGEVAAAYREANAAKDVVAAAIDVKTPSAGGGTLPGAGAAATQAEEHVTVFRFYTADNPNTLKPRMSSLPATRQGEIMNRINSSPAVKQGLGQLHMKGHVAESPFVSVGDNPLSLARSSDPWLKKISTGVSWGEPVLAERAPDLGIFRVPKSRVVYPIPTNELSVRETEILFVGDDLEQFLVHSWPNPF